MHGKFVMYKQHQVSLIVAWEQLECTVNCQPLDVAEITHGPIEADVQVFVVVWGCSSTLPECWEVVMETNNDEDNAIMQK